MRKFILVLAVSAIVLFGCSNTAEERDLLKPFVLLENNLKNKTVDTEVESIDGLITQDDMENDLLSFIANINGADDTRSINNKFVIELRDKTQLSDGNDNSDSRSIGETDENATEFFLYDVYNAENGSLGFAITSNDLRIGSVLAVVDDCSVDTECAQPFLNIFAGKLNEYIYEKTYEQESDTRKLDYTTINPSKYKYNLKSRVENLAYDKAMLKTRWGQREPYNKFLSGCVTGCAPIAMAQIFTQLEYNWQGLIGFDWKAMKANPYAEKLSSSVQDQIALLVRLLGVGMNATFSPVATSAYIDDVKSYLNKNKFAYIESYYNSDVVKNSLSSGIPVLCIGGDAIYYNKGVTQVAGGHAWVIDGYKNFTCTVKDKKTGKESRITDDFVHCNMGWDGTCNGYYRGAVFNVKEIAYSDTNEYYENGQVFTILWIGIYADRNEGYFRYDIKTISHIVPDFSKGV